jgi:hypothetical protein
MQPKKNNILPATYEQLYLVGYDAVAEQVIASILKMEAKSSSETL